MAFFYAKMQQGIFCFGFLLIITMFFFDKKCIFIVYQ